MIEITLGACPAGFGTIPSFLIMGEGINSSLINLNVQQNPVVVAHVYIYVSNLSITLISE
jgi:hypothetical protein